MQGMKRRAAVPHLQLLSAQQPSVLMPFVDKGIAGRKTIYFLTKTTKQIRQEQNLLS